MDNLPQSNQTKKPSTTPSGGGPQTGGMAKETGPHVSLAESPAIVEIGQEAPLSDEVTKSGVKIQPTTVHVPEPVAKLGVKATGASAPAANASAPVVLPLTDDQIAKGLHQGIMTSWRWLAEWCTKHLKNAHLVLKSVHGKVVRKKT